MGNRGWRVGRVLVLCACAVAAVWLVVKALGGWGGADPMASVLSGLATLAITAYSWGRPGASRELASAADDVARAVKVQWTAETALRRVYDPFALEVAWRPADAELVESWPTLTRTVRSWPNHTYDDGQWPADADGLTGADTEIGEVFTHRVPTRRLVVLGEPGSGKTVLLLRLLHDLLERRQPGDPVPVLFSLATWDPAGQSLDGWLADQLRRDHPGLRAPAPDAASHSGSQGDDLAKALLDTGHVLPLLDGFDELPDRLHPLALNKLNRAAPDRPLVLASRAASFRAAVSRGDAPARVNGAAGIHLLPLAPEHAARYLRRDAGGQDTPAAHRWDQVIGELGTDSPVGQSLSTPLGLFLARTIHNPRPGQAGSGRPPHPDELCDATAHPTRAALDTHLFNAYLPTVYAPDDTDGPGKPRWTAQQARNTLTFLARHLEWDRGGSPDIAWWELHRAIPLVQRRVARVLLAGGTVGTALGVATGWLSWALWGGLLTFLLFALLTNIPARLRPPPLEAGWSWSARRYGHGLAYLLVYGLVGAFVGAFGALLEDWLGADIPVAPSQPPGMGAPGVSAQSQMLGPETLAALGFGLCTSFALLIALPRALRPRAANGERRRSLRAWLRGAAHGATYWIAVNLLSLTVNHALGVPHNEPRMNVPALNGDAYAWWMLGSLGLGVFVFTLVLNGPVHPPTPNVRLRLSLLPFVVGFALSEAILFPLLTYGSRLVLGWPFPIAPSLSALLTLPLAVGLGLLIWLRAGLTPEKVDLATTTGPSTLLTRDRLTFFLAKAIGALVFTAVLALVAALVIAVLAALRISLRGDLFVPSHVSSWVLSQWAAFLPTWAGVGLLLGLFAGVKRAAWGVFVAARTYLSLRHRIPRDYMTFLRDAHERRGVLRQVGGVYQFRHVELQRHLAQQQLVPTPRGPAPLRTRQQAASAGR